MALSIKDNETDDLVRRLADQRKISITHAIRLAVRNELERGPTPEDARRLRIEAAIGAAQSWYRQVPPDLSRSDDDILGFGVGEAPCD